LAESGNRTIDDRRIGAVNGCVIEAVRLESAGFEILDDDVRTLGQPAHEAGAFGLRDVDGDRFLVAVRAREIGRPPAACFVAAPGPFDLDDLGTEIAKRLRRPRPGENARKVEHADVGERTAHRARLKDW